MNIGTRYKVTKNAWFLYVTKDMAMEQTGPYNWFACSNNTNPEYVFGWADYWSKNITARLYHVCFQTTRLLFLMKMSVTTEIGKMDSKKSKQPLEK